MSAVPFVILAAVLSFGAQPPQPPPKKSDPGPPQPPSIVNIEIVVGTYELHTNACGQGAAASTVFVTNEKEKGADKPTVKVYHCIGKKLHDHADHDKNAVAMEPADVRLVAGQRVRWVSKTHKFTVVDVIKPKNPKHQPQDSAAPLRPFGTFSKIPSGEVVTPPVPQINGEAVVVRQRYKVTFDVEGVGLVDPDLICSM